MNLCITLPKINNFLNNPLENEYFLFFMERKRNIIMDGGYFTKISLSTSFFTMNGIYLNVTISQKTVDDVGSGFDLTKNKYEQSQYNTLNEKANILYPTSQNTTKYYIHFDPFTLNNRTNTESIMKLEETILQMYGFTCVNKKPVYSLKTQLHNGMFKIHQLLTTDTTTTHNDHIYTSQNKFILKISGVWENTHNYGITYKCTL
jgi:hypothetical protein